jgi:hypothetical protein
MHRNVCSSGWWRSSYVINRVLERQSIVKHRITWECKKDRGALSLSHDPMPDKRRLTNREPCGII